MPKKIAFFARLALLFFILGVLFVLGVLFILGVLFVLCVLLVLCVLFVLCVLLILFVLGVFGILLVLIVFVFHFPKPPFILIICILEIFYTEDTTKNLSDREDCLSEGMC